MSLPPLYHWSPTERRAAISAAGLLPGSEPTTGPPEHAMPYTCLAENPQAAWRLSGALHGAVGQSWDLWQVWLADDHQVTFVPHHTPQRRDDRRWKEVRVYDPIHRRGIWLVATRVPDSIHFRQ